MGEYLYKLFLKDAIADLPTAVLCSGIDGLLSTFEEWLQQRQLIDTAKAAAFCDTCRSAELYVCDNCGVVYYRLADLKVVWPDIPRLSERLMPGGTVPAGECNECGALVYAETCFNGNRTDIPTSGR